MGRRILFVTTDQQRYDTLGVNGGPLSRTPAIDALAARGIRYERCQPTSVVCMPSRASMLTGQHPSTHGAWMNGVPLAIDAPSVAEALHDVGYTTALIGKAHFEPFMDPFGRFAENALANLGVPTIEQPWFDGRRGVHRGFDHLEFATHGVLGPLHYARWMRQSHPEAVGGFYAVVDADFNVNAAGGGDTGAPQVQFNPVPREWYHTDWVAQRTMDWLGQRGDDEDWFCWMSFPDPHHPWDPPLAEVARVPWREVDLPVNYPRTAGERETLLDAKARHWRAWYDGRLVSNYEAPARWVPATMTADQVREVNALNAVEVELIDEAVGRRSRRRLHQRPRRAPGRLRAALQGALPRRCADATAPHLAPGALARRRAGGGARAGLAGLAGRDVPRDGGPAGPRLGRGGRVAARRRGGARAGLRGHSHRVGLRALRGRGPRAHGAHRPARAARRARGATRREGHAGGSRRPGVSR